jgi:hypothetical protein
MKLIIATLLLASYMTGDIEPWYFPMPYQHQPYVYMFPPTSQPTSQPAKFEKRIEYLELYIIILQAQIEALKDRISSSPDLPEPKSIIQC